MSIFSAGTLECFHAGGAQIDAYDQQQELRIAVNRFPPASPLALGPFGGTGGSLRTVLVRRHRIPGILLAHGAPRRPKTGRECSITARPVGWRGPFCVVILKV